MTIRNLILDPNAAVYTDDEIVGKINSATAQIARANAIAAMARPIGTGEIDNAILAAGAVKANLDAMTDVGRGYIRTNPAIGQFKIVSIERDAVGRLKADYDDAGGEEHWAASPSLADVRAAIALASDGDTVMVPAGSATWSDVLTIDKFIYLIGAGSTLTHITGNVGAGWDIYLIDFYADNPGLDLPFRLSGFDLNGNNNCQVLRLWAQQGYILHSIRIDHNRLRGNPAPYNLMARRGPVYGVADNNVIELTSASPGSQMCDNALWSPWCWQNTNPEFGTANNFYFEDNTISGGAMCACAGGQGGRYAMRYNDITNLTDSVFWMFDMHGSYDDGMLATMCVEVYGNTITSAYNVGSLDQRGSMCLFYDNIFSCPGAYIQVRNEYGENVDTMYSPATSPDGSTKRVNRSYYWNNKNNGALIYPNVPDQSGAGGTAYYSNLSPGRWVPYPDKDFWTQNPNFNGSVNLSQIYDNENIGMVNIAGMGVGLLSARPASCAVADVGYWATDTNTLYRWHDSAWETFYTPYIYPHPLRGE